MSTLAAPPAREGARPGLFYGYIIVAAATIVMAALSAGGYSFGVFLKPVSEEFLWTRSAISGAHSLTMFVQGLAYLMTGRLTDRFGPRAVMTVCAILFGLGYILVSRISELWQLYLSWGVLVGLGMSGGLVPMTSTVARWFVKKRGLMTGIAVAGVGAGTMIGPPLASQSIQSYGWRTSYVILGASFLALLFIAAQFLRKNPEQRGLLPRGNSQAKQATPVLAAVGLSLQEALHTRQFWMLVVMYVLFGISQMVIMIHIVPFATDQGISPTSAAAIVTIIGAAGLGGRVMLGGMADRIGIKPAFLIGMALMSASLLLLLVVRDVRILSLFGAIFGFGYGGEIALMSPIIAELFGLRVLGAIMGVISFAYFAGCSIGPVLAGSIFDTTGSYYPAFTIAAAFSITGLAMVIMIRPLRNKGPKPA